MSKQESPVTKLPNAPPPPPKMTGVAENDIVMVSEYLWQFYTHVRGQWDYAKQIGGYDPATFNPASLPDPASSTVGIAQKTANDAYALAVEAKLSPVANRVRLTGDVTISETNNQATVTFASPLADDKYMAVIQAKTTSGTPPIDATLVINKTCTTTNFDFRTNAAPGVGKSVTFEYMLIGKD